MASTAASLSRNELADGEVPLWRLYVLRATYLLLVGGTRFLVEFLRVNAPVAGPLTVAQLASLTALAAGLWLSLGARSTARSSPTINKI